MKEDLTVDNVIPELLRAVPEVKTMYEEELKTWDEGEDPGLHNLFGMVFMNHWEQLLRENEKHEELQRVFDFLERMANSSDEEVDNVVAVSCLEYMGDDPEILKTARQYMGTKSREVSDDLERGWGRME